MSKLCCPCGFVHNLSPIPDDGWVLIRDSEIDTYEEIVVRRHQLGSAPEDTPEWDALLNADRQYAELQERLYECPRCCRIMWMRGIDGRIDVYAKEQTSA